MRILRTVIGSFPRLHDDASSAIDEAVALQKRNGIDILSDGEQRGDMILYLSHGIPGLAVEHEVPVISGKIGVPDKPETISKVSDYFALRQKYPDLSFKVTLTGPTTLGMSCATRKTSPPYRHFMDMGLYADLADALHAIVRPLAKARAPIQIDEPFISQGFRDYKERIRLLDHVLEGCDPDKSSVHVCGYLGKQPIINELMKLDNANVLSHAFSVGHEKANLKLFEKSLCEGCGKKLGAGIVSVSPMFLQEVDPPVRVSARLSEIAGLIGLENIAYVHPDCGLRATRYDLVEPILRSLNEGTNMFEESVQ